MQIGAYEIKTILYCLVAIAGYWVGLRLWNKGKKNIVNLDAGRLQLYALLTAIFFVGILYYLLEKLDILSFLSLSFITFGLAKTSTASKIMDILDGRGDAGKKLNKVVIIGFGVVVGFWLLQELSDIQELISLTPYAPAILLIIFGFWMIGNRDDNLTRWGYGLLSAGILSALTLMKFFG